MSSVCLIVLYNSAIATISYKVFYDHCWKEDIRPKTLRPFPHLTQSGEKIYSPMSWSSDDLPFAASLQAPWCLPSRSGLLRHLQKDQGTLEPKFRVAFPYTDVWHMSSDMILYCLEGWGECESYCSTGACGWSSRCNQRRGGPYRAFDEGCVLWKYIRPWGCTGFILLTLPSVRPRFRYCDFHVWEIPCS